MEFISGEDRGQAILLPESTDEYVDDNNPVRVIEAYIDSLDLEGLGFSKPAPRVTGRLYKAAMRRQGRQFSP